MILYQDNHVLLLEKPAGLLTQPSGTDEDSLEEQGKQLIGRPYLHAVHRLDRLVSGIVLFAKTSKALSRLTKAIRENQIQKKYLARVEGELPDQGTLEHYLLHGDRKALIVSSETPGAKKAILNYKKLENGLIEIDLITGRYHQIRAQFAAIGCPLIGDSKYGSKSYYKNGIALHHHQMTFPHPISKEEIVISSKSIKKEFL